MNVKRVFYMAALGMGAFLTQGCSVDATPTLPSFNVNYNFPLVGGAPILGELFLPSTPARPCRKKRCSPLLRIPMQPLSS